MSLDLVPEIHPAGCLARTADVGRRCDRNGETARARLLNMMQTYRHGCKHEGSSLSCGTKSSARETLPQEYHHHPTVSPGADDSNIPSGCCVVADCQPVTGSRQVVTLCLQHPHRQFSLSHSVPDMPSLHLVARQAGGRRERQGGDGFVFLLT